MTTRHLAYEYHCNRKTISTLLNKNGVSVTKSRMDDEQIEEAKKLYESGLTLKAVGERFGIGECTVSKALKQAGVKIRQSHRYTSEERRKQIKKLS